MLPASARQAGVSAAQADSTAEMSVATMAGRRVAGVHCNGLPSIGTGWRQAEQRSAWRSATERGKAGATCWSSREIKTHGVSHAYLTSSSALHRGRLVSVVEEAGLAAGSSQG